MVEGKRGKDKLHIAQALSLAPRSRRVGFETVFYHGGLAVSTLVRNRPMPSDFSGRKLPQCRFVQSVNKAVCLMLPICNMQKIPTLTWKCSWSAKVLIISRPQLSISRLEVSRGVLEVGAPSSASGNIQSRFVQ
jgi:hypothetical protein